MIGIIGAMEIETAALAAAVELAREKDGKKIVFVAPDSGDRYYSTALFTE